VSKTFWRFAPNIIFRSKSPKRFLGREFRLGEFFSLYVVRTYSVGCASPRARKLLEGRRLVRASEAVFARLRLGGGEVFTQPVSFRLLAISQKEAYRVPSYLRLTACYLQLVFKERVYWCRIDVSRKTQRLQPPIFCHFRAADREIRMATVAVAKVGAAIWQSD